jgi:ABC-type sugar transport system ATPase subunit
MLSSKNIVLEAKNISKYFGTITALENVNLTVREGECLGVVGDNGAGKSTFMKVLSGLYKPSSGSLFFNGNKIKTHPISSCYNKILKKPLSIRITSLFILQYFHLQFHLLHQLNSLFR